jgi:hypothetical protein
MNSTSAVPAQKITAQALAGALVIIACWLLGFAHIEVPPLVQGAFATVIGYAVGYIVPPAARDTITPKGTQP